LTNPLQFEGGQRKIENALHKCPVIGRAIDCGLDRALVALRPHWPNAAMGDKALADLVAVVDRVSVKNPASADGGRL
jgi:hypothetical protein